MTMLEVMARGMVNATKPRPAYGTLDAYDLLKDWATLDKSKAKPGTVGHRCHPDNITESKRELAEAHKLAQAALTAIEEAGFVVVPREPTEAMWGGLARDIMMWMSMYSGPNLTPRNLFLHLERTGRDIPDWLREGEMSALDHVPSKGTRAYLIYRAMTAAPGKEG